MRDLYNNIRAASAIAPAVINSNTNGEVIDTLDCNRMAVVVSTGAVAGSGDFSLKLQDSDTTASGDFGDVPADLVDSDAPATLEAASSYRLGYRGYKRYVRLVATKAGGTSIALGATAVQHDLRDRPA